MKLKCRNCKFSKWNFFGYKCYNPAVMILDIECALNLRGLKSTPVYCSYVRKDPNSCGPEGKYFVKD